MSWSKLKLTFLILNGIALIPLIAIIYVNKSPVTAIAATDNSIPSSIYHKLGSYGIHDNTEISAASQTGISYAIFNHANAPSNFQMPYFDATLLDMIYGHYHNSCQNQPSSCSMSTSELNALESEARQYITATSATEKIVGYYLMDDSPGDIRNAVSLVHRLIKENNEANNLSKPALCGFGAVSLDYKDSPTDPSFKPDTTTTSGIFINDYSPTSCDLIAVYIYGYNHRILDWSMQRLMPEVKNLLTQHGWDNTKTPFIGTPQAFGVNSGIPNAPSFYQTPSSSELATQTEAFCREGAIGIAAFVWRFDDPNYTTDELSENSILRDGLSQGVSKCQNYWNSQVNNTTLYVDLMLHGIGKAGDNSNPNSGGTTNPQRIQRTVMLEIFNSQNQLVLTKDGSISFNPANGNFSGTIDLGSTFSTGLYTVKVKTSQFLKTIIPGIQNITPGQISNLPQTILITGDISNDNRVDILDYNILIDCYSDLQPAGNCSESNKKLSADLTDDGNVNQFDYNLFLRELTNINGQ